MTDLQDRLEDVTPLFMGEHWETWLILLRNGVKTHGWAQWIDLWVTTNDKYWKMADEGLILR